MSEGESRGRERVPVEIGGAGEVKETGAGFDFSALDLSVMGMLVKTGDSTPKVGQTLRLTFELPGEDGQVTPVLVEAEVMRVGHESGGTVCGVRWLEQKSANLEELEAFYTARFFDMMD